jgi:hypothetical protein
MLDGLWVGEWLSNINSIRAGSGVLIFCQGKIFGGNDRVYYTGNFASEGDQFYGNIQVTYYAGEPLGIFGLMTADQPEDILIAGRISGDEITLEGILKSNRKTKSSGFLKKKAGSEIF